MTKERMLSVVANGQTHHKKLKLVVSLLFPALISVCEQDDSNAVLPLPEGRLEDI